MKILIVVDMQNDFITGSLGTAEAQAIIPAVNAKIRQYLDNGDVVVYTRDTHYDNYMDTDEGKHLPVPHCIQYSDGWQIADAVIREEGSCVVDKETFGCFDLPECILEWYGYDGATGEVVHIDSIELVGLCTDICVISNALLFKAFCTNSQFAIPIKVDAKCCAGVTPESHAAAIATMKMCQIEVEE